jgi:protoheme IX farnesyltransferase
VVAGIQSTRRQVLLYTLPMAAAAVAPWALGLTGWVYGGAAVILSAIFLALAFAVFANKASEPKAMGPEKKLFAFSIIYLFGLFAALVVDRWLI